jgi:thiamine biosynthesis protein ThiI
LISMKTCVLIRYSEIGLKGPQTRRRMEKDLASNIKDCLDSEKIKFRRIRSGNSRVIIFTEDAENASVHLSRVFGVASSSPAIYVEADLEKIKAAALPLYGKGTFRITSRRITKSMKEDSTKINEVVGAHIVKEKGAKVKLKNSDVDIGIEIIGKSAYLFTKTIQGPAGLPLGAQGTLACIIEDEKGVNRSVIACYLMMKRGSGVVPVCFSKSAFEIANHIYKKWMYGSRFKPEIIGKTKDRKKMYKITESVALEYGCIAIAVGEDITSLKKISELDNSISTMVLRPTVGYTSKQMQELHKKIIGKL